MFRVNFRHCVQGIFEGIWAAAIRQGMAIKGVTFFQFLGKELPAFQKNEFLVVVAKGLFGL